MMRIVRAGFSSAVGAAALCLVSLAALPPETLAGGTAAQPAALSRKLKSSRTDVYAPFSIRGTPCPWT